MCLILNFRAGPWALCAFSAARKHRTVNQIARIHCSGRSGPPVRSNSLLLLARSHQNALENAARAPSEPPLALENAARARSEPPAAIENAARARSEPPAAIENAAGAPYEPPIALEKLLS